MQETRINITADGDSVWIQLPTGAIEIWDDGDIAAFCDTNKDDVRDFSKITEAFKFAGGT